MVRPIFTTNGNLSPSVVMNTDFQQSRTNAPPSYSGAGGAEWDTAIWDVSAWTSGDAIRKNWQGVTGVGYCGGLRMVTQTSNLSCRWQATDVLFEVGGVL